MVLSSKALVDFVCCAVKKGGIFVSVLEVNKGVLRVGHGTDKKGECN